MPVPIPETHLDLLEGPVFVSLVTIMPDGGGWRGVLGYRSGFLDADDAAALADDLLAVLRHLRVEDRLDVDAQTVLTSGLPGVSTLRDKQW